MAEEVTDLAEERRKRGKDDDSMYVCPECAGAVWFALTDGTMICVTCGLEPEDIRVVRA